MFLRNYIICVRGEEKIKMLCVSLDEITAIVQTFVVFEISVIVLNFEIQYSFFTRHDTF